MIYRNEDGTNVLQFGTGDIEVGNGFMDDVDVFNPCVIFVEQEERPIGEIGQVSEKLDGECTLRSDAHTMFIFTDVRSIDVVIDHLQQAKEGMLKEPTSQKQGG